MAKRSSSKAGRNGRTQSFTLRAPDAARVQLVGDFTHWEDHPINLQKGVDGVWRTTVILGQGTYHYRFIVDGEWRNDPECALRAPNPFGTENMMRLVA